MIPAISVSLDQSAAERRAERIRLRLDAIADNYTTVMPMIREAIELHDDVALGYRSVSEYVADRFGGALHRLGVDVRRQVVRELNAAGLSTRAIAPVVGVTDRQVRYDVKAGGKDFPPDPLVNLTTGEVSDDYQTPANVAGAEAEVVRVEPSTEPTSGAAPRPSVVGIDGKTYTQPVNAPRTARRRRQPLADQFFDVAFNLSKVIERVVRLTDDDRFPRNAEKVAAKHRNDLIRLHGLLQEVIDRLPTA